MTGRDQDEGRSVLVTGSSGYVGRQLIARLVSGVFRPLDTTGAALFNKAGLFGERYDYS